MYADRVCRAVVFAIVPLAPFELNFGQGPASLIMQGVVNSDHNCRPYAFRDLRKNLRRWTMNPDSANHLRPRIVRGSVPNSPALCVFFPAT